MAWSRTFGHLKTWTKAQKTIVPLKTWVKIQNLWSSENMNQCPKTLGPLKIWAKIQNLWSSENMSQDQEPLVLWKLEPKPKKSLVFWKHEPRSRTLGPLKCMTRIFISSWPQVSMFCTHSKKKKFHAWTMFGLDPPTKRYVGNLLQDSVHILIHYMTIYIFICMHHTFTTVKY